MKCGVLLVHGLGIQGPDWAGPVIRRLRDSVSQAISRYLSPKDAVSADEVIEVEPAYWEDILRDREETLRKLLEAGPSLTPSSLWRRLWHWLRRAEYHFVADSIGDIIGYLNPDTRAAIQEELANAINRLSQRMPKTPDKLPLTVLAHSLGTVISSEYIWDRAKLRLESGQEGFDAHFRFVNFFTVGSPLALFSLKFGGPEVFKKPVQVEDADGRWVNLFDPDDPVGMRLKPLNAVYQQAVLADVAVESGVYLQAHNGYFTRSRVLEVVARKLVLDWAAHNHFLSEEKIKELRDSYDRWVGELSA